jgi:hypothetical protein
VYVVALLAALAFARSGRTRVAMLSVCVIFLTALNPFISNQIAHHITSVLTYWRLFWLTMTELVIALAIVWVSSIPSRKPALRLGYGALAIAAFALALTTRSWLITPAHGFERTANKYRLPAAVVAEAPHLPHDAFVLAPIDRSASLRLMRPDLTLVYSRPSYMKWALRNDQPKLKDFADLFATVQGTRAPDAQFEAQLRKYHVGSVIVDSHLPVLGSYMQEHYQAEAKLPSATLYSVN